MLYDLIQLLNIYSSILAWKVEYIPQETNLNIIAIGLPQLWPGLVDITWKNVDDEIDLAFQTDEESLNLQYNLDPENIVYQSFSRDNLVIYYDRNHYNLNDFFRLVEPLVQHLFDSNYSIRFYYATPKFKDISLFELINTYWFIKPKDVTFSGSITSMNEKSFPKLINKFLEWRTDNKTLDHYKQPSLIYRNFRNEYFEENFPPQMFDYLVVMYSDDDLASKEHLEFFNILADRVNNTGVIVGGCDLTSSLFWGIWPYSLPFVRFYSKKFDGNFEYYYEQQEMGTYLQFLKDKSPNYQQFIQYIVDERLQGENLEKYYWKRHCENRDNNTRLLIEWLLYEIVDYDSIVDLYLQEDKYKNLPGYEIHIMGHYKEEMYDQPYFQPIELDTHQRLKIVMVGQPQYSDSRKGTRFLMKEEFMVLGKSSYRSFPVITQWEYETDDTIRSLDRDWFELAKNWAGWLHNSRNPSVELRNLTVPRILFAHSDLMLKEVNDQFPNGFESFEKDRYDIAMSQLGNETWHEDCKNWTLGVQLYDQLAATGKYKMLLIGRELPPSWVGKVDRVDMLPQNEFFDTLARTDILLVPSMSDASPRIITQGLTVDTAIVVNIHIAGGWKYVNEQTGAFIEDPNDIEKVIDDVKRRRKEGILRPRQWFLEFSTYQPQRIQVYIQLMWFKFGFNTDINGFEPEFDRLHCFACTG
ncbi:UNKNOWN [Stylonychia lemnae]|uniref:Uncharacterized protein n=1 Tax=Stylonychia lemnae TaxID=5949 RepID=A0A077ZYP6_STYLE|nr:UNKNOWN [Stylonychia lemnae]|eukprot:CDW75015.1 UNKNOWN [Stylonychia lemnae]